MDRVRWRFLIGYLLAGVAFELAGQTPTPPFTVEVVVDGNVVWSGQSDKEALPSINVFVSPIRIEIRQPDKILANGFE